MDIGMRSPADLLACIPSLIRRQPEEMLVLLTIKDDHVQSVLVMQHCTGVDETPAYVMNVMEAVAELRPDALAMVFYTEGDSWCSHEPFEHVCDLIHKTIDTLTPAFVVPGILVRGGRFHEYHTGHWHDMAEVKDSPMAASLVLNGVVLEPAGVSIPAPVSVTDSVTAAIDAAIASLPVWPMSTPIPEAWGDPVMVDARVLFGSLLERGFGATESEAVRLIACFQNPFIRDRLMVDAVNATVDIEAFARTITGNSEDRLDDSRMGEAVSLLNNLMQWACDRHRPSLLVAQAWLHWIQGRAMDAEAYCRAALELDPGHGLAAMFLRYILDIKRMPSNVFRRREQ
jgi:hypothetical protein